MDKEDTCVCFPPELILGYTQICTRKRRQADEDALELARLGYKQEFKRAFSPLQVFGLVFSIYGLFPSIA